MKMPPAIEMHLVQKVVSSSNGNSQLYAVHKRLNKKTVEEVIAEAENH